MSQVSFELRNPDVADKATRIMWVVPGGGTWVYMIGLMAQMIEERLRKNNLVDYVDGFSATSAGAIATAGMNAPILEDGGRKRPATSTEITNFFRLNAEDIFQERKEWWDKYVLSNKSKYHSTPIKETLGRVFGTCKTSDLIKPTAISLYNATPDVQQIEYAVGGVDKRQEVKLPSQYTVTEPDWQLSEVIQASCAAPKYFPGVHLRTGTRDAYYIDGGVCDNTPYNGATMMAKTIAPKEKWLFVTLNLNKDSLHAMAPKEIKRGSLLTYVSRAKNFPLVQIPRDVRGLNALNILASTHAENFAFAGLDFNITLPAMRSFGIREYGLDDTSHFPEMESMAHAMVSTEEGAMCIEKMASAIEQVELNRTNPLKARLKRFSNQLRL